MTEWTIPVTWEVCGKVKVEANTLAEALRYVKEDPDDMPLPTESDYVEGSFAPSMDEIEEIRDLYNNGQSDGQNALSIEKIANAYSYLYDDQFIAVEDDYQEYLRDQFAVPGAIDWDSLSEEEARATLSCLLEELHEDRADFYEVAENAGLSGTDLAEMGFVLNKEDF